MSKQSMIPKRRSHGLPLIAGVTALLVLGGPEAARGFAGWINASGGSYTTASNWSPPDVPNTSGEGAFFNLNDTYTVTFSGNVTALTASVTDANVTWDLDSSGTARTYALGAFLEEASAPERGQVSGSSTSATVMAVSQRDSS